MTEKDLLILQKRKEKTKALVTAIRSQIAKIKLPAQIQLNNWSNITNPSLFFESHLQQVEHYDNSVQEPYAERLKLGLQLIGINAAEINKSIK